MSLRPTRMVADRRLLALIMAIGPATLARGQTTAPTTQATTRPSDVEVHEWAVFVFDGLSDKLNAHGLVRSDLPAFIPTHRPDDDAAASPAISPIGVVRFTGHLADTIDVQLSRGEGQFMASWPRAEERTSGLLWRKLALQDQPGGDGLIGTEATTAVGRLRATGRPYIVDGKGGCEPFLLYDAELPTRPLITVEATPDNVRATNATSNPIRGLTFFRHAAGGWTTANFGELAVVPLSTPAVPARPPTGPTSRATTTAALSATTQPASVPLVAVHDAAPDRLAADWVRRRLADADLSDGDRDLIASMIVRYGFDGGRLAGVCKLGEADMDRMMPIEVMPQPRRITRVGIVILRDVDPSAGTDIDDLITQLGDPAWSTREAAFKALAVAGSVATAKLQMAAKSADQEVAWRAERLLASPKSP